MYLHDAAVAVPAVISLAFNALPYLAPLRETVRRILGPQAFS
jgi:hypothetical protein